ncbi:MAG: hypothetical protein SGPRY_011057, partial [Prymnesium sp.]
MQADAAFGWVLEMWGYTLAANRLAIRHTVWNELQAEPSALWHKELESDPRIYHYTFGLEYTLDGIPGTHGWAEGSGPQPSLTEEAYRSSSLAQNIVSRGPWEWADKQVRLAFA